MSIFASRRRARPVEPRIAATDLGGGDAELVMYGDVMAEDSRDWWTGEPDGRPAVTSEALNRELDKLRGAERVTVRLNSCGGDLYTGLAIHSVLRSLDAEVTVRVEGIAASAASVIACAGDRVVVTPGSILMVHEGALGLMGYYTGADLRALVADMDAGVRAMLGVYAAKTGRPEDELREMVEAETWMVGQEIVDAGFADVLEDAGQDCGEPAVEDEGGGEVMVAGVLHDLSRFRHVPDLAARVSASANHTEQTPGEPSPVSDMSEPPRAAEEEGETFMNISELREQHPDLVAEIEAAARQSERDRLAAIDEVADGLPADMVREAKYGEHPMGAEQLAIAALRAQSAERSARADADRAAAARYLADAQSDAEESGTDEVEPDPTGGEGEDTEEEQAKKEVQQCAQLRAQMRGGR
ncbi:head maturation protease, ClpP-related [Olsenella sp. An293]|uniref:head maturation protease, ClpP-related n=1 Tax=Olsenella sp. An293 TaxID=1965626 RepID=UPI000B3A1CF2|nr:head maturation protease, ClpP-related [Olsenella sp. An293]OUO32260.1 hypothetical protein B5F85_06905 [Olsenella sp. An293]